MLEQLKRDAPDAKHQLLFRLNEWISEKSSSDTSRATGKSVLPIPRDPTHFGHYMDLLLLIISDHFIQISVCLLFSSLSDMTQGLLSAVTNVLKTSDLCPIGDWPLGNKILKVCSNPEKLRNLLENYVSDFLIIFSGSQTRAVEAQYKPNLQYFNRIIIIYRSLLQQRRHTRPSTFLLYAIDALT